MDNGSFYKPERIYQRHGGIAQLEIYLEDLFFEIVTQLVRASSLNRAKATFRKTSNVFFYR